MPEDSLAATPATTTTAPLQPAPPLPRGTFDNARPQAAPPEHAAGTGAAAVGGGVHDLSGLAGQLPLRVDVQPGGSLLDEKHPFASFGPAAAVTKGTSSSAGSSLAAAQFLATRVFDVPSFSSLSLEDTLQASHDRGPSAHASSAVLASLAPRCEAADVDEFAEGWNGAVLVGPVPSVPGAVSSGSLGSIGSPSRSSAIGVTPTSPLGMSGRHRRDLEAEAEVETGEEVEEDEHRTLYVTLPGPVSAPTPPKSPVESEKVGSGDALDEKTSLIQRPLPIRRISRSSSSASSAVAATLRHAVLNVLDLASETLSCTTVVFVLERNRPDLADLLHGLCYVGGQVLHVKGRPRRGYGCSARGMVVGSPGGRSMGSWDPRTPHASPANAAAGAGGGSGSGMGMGASGSHRGSYGSMGSITAQFPGSVVMPVRIAGGGGGAGAGSSGQENVLGDDDLLLLPRADVILVAVAL
ncbi:hypothetical protein CF327_g7040 [Tilletia walkeri]|nr:hypothetical protein CF327_g7040 [Tilletia walkeri]